MSAIDLKPFCSTSHARMIKPWVANGFRYATDGRIMVRCPAPGEADAPTPVNGCRPPDVSGFWSFREVRREPWPEPDPLDTYIVDCPTCEGSGKVDRQSCATCDGTGEHECDCGNVHACDDCMGQGTWGGDECPACHGDRDANECATHVIGKRVAGRYADLIRALPGVVALVVEGDTKEGAERAVRFAFDGGDGIVMPRCD